MMIRELFTLLMILVVVLTFVRIIEDGLSREQDMYKSCLDACKAKPTYWNQNPEIINFDHNRNECIRVCNSFHYSLTK